MKVEVTAQTRGVAALGRAALVLRVFALLTIEESGAYSASWLCVPLGALLSLPALALVLAGRRERLPGRARLMGRHSGQAACALLAAVAVYDAAASSRLLAGLVGYAALNEHSTAALSLPLIAAALAACLMGAGALTAPAVIWRRVALVLAALVALFQLRELRPGWLMPLLGPGPRAVLLGALDSAGCMTMAALGMYVLGGDGPAGLPRALAGAAGLCMAAVMVFGMLIPALPGVPDGRLFRMELLLDSARNGLAAELILLLMMFGGLLLAGFELMTAAASLSIALPRLSTTACALLCGAASAALALGGLTAEEAARNAAEWYYPLALSSAALMAVSRGERRRAA